MTRKQLAAVALILISIVLIAFFGTRALHAFRRFKGHHPPPPGRVETDVELIRDWMTVPFISRMYHVPDERIFAALNIPPQPNRDKSLKLINKDYFPQKNGYVLDLVKKTVISNEPPPKPASNPTAIPRPPITVTP